MTVDDLNLARNLWENIRAAISQVADPAYQERVWLGDVPDERSSFVEAYYLIVDSDIDVIRDHRIALMISDTEWERVLRFIVRFLTYYSKINDPYAQDEILKDSDWSVVVAVARDALNAPTE